MKEKVNSLDVPGKGLRGSVMFSEVSHFEAPSSGGHRGNEGFYGSSTTGRCTRCIDEQCAVCQARLVKQMQIDLEHAWRSSKLIWRACYQKHPKIEHDTKRNTYQTDIDSPLLLI